jgi:Tfp pilus assembly protein PilP
MKPSFALSFTEDSIQLLHRVGKGWVVVGDTPFADPNLDDALDDMRRTALGLEPAGFATKLVIPNSQIRYMELEAPGPSEAEREAQIRAALEGKTPYAPEDLVFDWSGKGKLVRVAVVARETLDEAESFAVERKFNPVGFVSIPDYGDFSGEPWFGTTSAAAGLLPAGETVERDKSAIRIQTRGTPRSEPPDTAETAPLAAAAPAAPPEVTAPPQAVVAEPEPLPEVPVAAPQLWPEDTQPDESAAPEQPAPEPFAPPPFVTATTGVAEDVPAPVAAPLRDKAEPNTAEADTAESEAAEAPFTHVPDAAPFPEEDDDLRGADPVAAPAGLSPPRVDPLSDPALDEDLPPQPSQAAMVAFASRRGDSDGRPPILGAAARPDPAVLARAAHGKPVEDLPPMPRPPQAGSRPAPATGGLRGAAGKGISALVTTPALAGSRKVKAKPGPLAPPPSPARAAVVAATGPADAAKSLTRPGGTFGNRPPAARSSRTVLFLSLVAILLLCMALVAAWSTFWLSSRGDEVEATQVAAADVPAEMPAVEDEMLADGEEDLIGTETEAVEAGPDVALEDPAALEPSAESLPAETSEADLAEVTAVPVAEAAPDTAVPLDSPAAQTLAETQDEIFLATSDTPPPALDALALPAPAAASDVLPDAQMPPPPFGTVYAFDAQGLLIPTPEGIVSPDGVLLIAGKPPVVPPSRSEVATAAAETARLAAAAAETAAAAEVPEGTALVDAVPVGEQPADAPADATETVAAAGPEAQPNPDLADRRPRERPAGLVPNPDDAALATEAEGEVQAASLRPRERPVVILAAAEAARQQTANASLALAPSAEDAAQAEADLAAAAAAEAANPSVVAISRRPAARPKDFSRAVEAAVAAAIRAPEPEPEPEKRAAAAAPAPEPDEQDELNEPEVVASAAPKIPSKASVAKQATFKNALNLSKLNLIGVYGTQSKRYALIRQANGRYKKVKVGDKIDGGRIEAITQNEVRYQKGGRLIALKMPKG